MQLPFIFGADPITQETIAEIKKYSPDLIIYAVPLMLFFTAVEYFVSKHDEKEVYQNKELLGSIFVGLGNIISNLMTKLLLFLMVVVIYNWVPWRMELHWWMFFPAYVILDLCSYWAHRISHEQRFWWCTHITHHSGNKYNLAVSFRLSWIQQFKLLFLLPLAFIGFHPLIFFVANQIAVLFQFWVHTEYVPRLHPWIEYIIATPSNHRVHHGSQLKYLDKNYGASFIIWDRMFGTYQPEEERAIYGLTTPIPYSADPVYLNFHEIKDIYHDVKKAKTWKEKWFYVFGSPSQIGLLKKAEAEKKMAEKAPIITS
jgi:sterol desaturase/sphingolipid hydroxylase (fatty acid hydroxylase superfamily)